MEQRIEQGFVLLARELFGSSLWGLSPDYTRLAICLLMQARHDERPHTLEDGTVINRGDLVTSLDRLAEQCAWYEHRARQVWSRKKVSRLLVGLQKIGFIAFMPAHAGTFVSINNYGHFQDAENYKAHTFRTTREQGRTLTRTENKGKNVEEEASAFPNLLKALEENPMPETAMAAIRAAHPAFAKVQEFQLANSLAGQPDRSKWAEAVQGLAAAYAGADLPKPNRTLQNWLAGKPASGAQAGSERPQYVDPDDPFGLKQKEGVRQP